MADARISVDDWMAQQPVSCCQRVLACCSSKKARRRHARQALFKRLTLEELERRYQKYVSEFRPEEDQVVRQVIDKFKRGWYVDIQAKHLIGTFYSPISPLFTLFCLLVHSTFLAQLASFTTYIFKSLCRKDSTKACLGYVSLLLYPLLGGFDLLVVLAGLALVVILILLFALIELPILLIGMCYYGLGRFQKCGCFVYCSQLNLITAQGTATHWYGISSYHTVSLAKYEKAAYLTLLHASLCRTIFCNPVIRMFKNMNWAEYSYGDIEGAYLSTREVQMYGVRQQQSAALYSEAKSLA